MSQSSPSFSTATARDAATTTAAVPNPQQRRVNRSCLECTRRKVKCDGNLPCASCVYYRTAEACAYRQRSKRNAVSRSTYNKASETIDAQGRVLQTLFPGHQLSDLADKSQEELLELLDGKTPASHDASDALKPSPPPAPYHELHPTSATAPASDSGDAAAERQWDESLDASAGAAVASDDVNAFGHATGQHGSSYLGMTSVSAMFRAIFRLCPWAEEQTAARARTWTAVPPHPLPPMSAFGRDPSFDVLQEQRFVDFYFEHIHAISPFLDEPDFRRQHAQRARTDRSWLGLANMVFAMGSIASGSDHLHEQYYLEARRHIDLDSLGSGNLEVLQALCVLGGYYLHYRNSPNMAFGIHGAAHRMAIALGLHREPRRRPSFADAADADKHRRRTETRRRTWWSLFCLDTWATMAQGRPTPGRWDPSTMDTLLPEPLDDADAHTAASLRANIQFCLLCDKIQARCARVPRLSAREVLAFDAELTAWYHAVPLLIRERTPASPPGLMIAREWMRNRYYNVRVILSRSALLYMADDQRRRRGGREDPVPPPPPPPPLAPEQQQILDTCCHVAAQAINSIALCWTPNRVHVWNSAWNLFQVSMVPLLSIALERSLLDPRQQRQQHQQNPPPSPSSESMQSWKESLFKSLQTFTLMRDYMRPSDRSPDIVAALYEALMSEPDGPPAPTPSVTEAIGVDPFGWADEQLADLSWSSFLGSANLVQGSFPFT